MAKDTQNVDPAPEGVEKKKRKAHTLEETGGLNINSMMDIMTILLVFLLVTITSDPLNIKQDDFLKLAHSTAEFNPEDSIPATITKRAIVVDHKKIVKIDCTTQAGQQCQPEDYTEGDKNHYSIDKSFKEDGSESSFLIEPLYKKLDDMVKQQKEENKELGREFKGVFTIVCDRDIPFRIIAEVVHSAGRAGLSDLRFAIIKTAAR